MVQNTIFCAGSTSAVKYAAEILQRNGWTIQSAPSDETKFVLLDVPSMDPCGNLRNGGSLQTLLNAIPTDAVILGGALDNPLLCGRKTIDLLKNETYLAENAKITAYCTLPIILDSIPVTFENTSILIIGWGRIGKSLAEMLHLLKADVTVASRNPENEAEIRTMGMEATDTLHITPKIYRVIVNTAPAPITLQNDSGGEFSPVKIDLASVKGLEGADVIRARGLPGIHAPESSGKLIAEMILEHMKECSP